MHGPVALLMRALAFFCVYAFGTGGLMWLNTSVLGWGDPAYGEAGWWFYWPIWGLGYLPVAIAGLLMGSPTLPHRRAVAVMWIYLPATLAAMEVSFALDVAWQVVLAEWVVLPGIFLMFSSTLRGAR